MGYQQQVNITKDTAACFREYTLTSRKLEFALPQKIQIAYISGCFLDHQSRISSRQPQLTWRRQPQRREMKTVYVRPTAIKGKSEKVQMGLCETLSIDGQADVKSPGMQCRLRQTTNE